MGASVCCELGGARSQWRIMLRSLNGGSCTIIREPVTDTLTPSERSERNYALKLF